MMTTFKMAVAFAVLCAANWWPLTLLLFVVGGLLANVAYWGIYALTILFGPPPS